MKVIQRSPPTDAGWHTHRAKPDFEHGEQDHLFPFVLPSGGTVLFTIAASSADNAQIAALDLSTGARKTLVRGGSHAEYVETGHLVYGIAGTLRAVRFDANHLEVRGDPVPVVDQLAMFASGGAEYSVSRSGTLVYVPGGAPAGTGALRSLVWVDRSGREEPLKAPQRAYSTLRLSPDSSRLAVSIADQELDVWMWDFVHKTLGRLTFDPAGDQTPIWTPDGRRIIFSSGRAGTSNLFWQAADGTGTVERLTTSVNPEFTPSISPDGTSIVIPRGAFTPQTTVWVFIWICIW